MSSYITKLPKESDIEKITNKMEELIDSFDTLNVSIKKISAIINEVIWLDTGYIKQFLVKR